MFHSAFGVVFTVVFTIGMMRVSKTKDRRYYCVAFLERLSHIYGVTRHKGTSHGKKNLACVACGRPYTF